MNEQNETGLKWLSIDAIHAHCRIDFACEDAELEQMGIAAEQAILDLTRRTFDNFIDTYGRIPDPIYNATPRCCWCSRSIRTATQRSSATPRRLPSASLLW